MSITNLQPLRDSVFVEDLDQGAHLTKKGIILLDDNMSERGIHCRWGKIYAIGPKVEGIEVGEWILVEHGRWTNATTLTDEDGKDRKIWRIEFPKACLGVSKTDPRDEVLTNHHGLRIKH